MRRGAAVPEPDLTLADPAWTGILLLLRARFGTDFARYRTPTLRRRLARRLAMTHCADLQAYLEHLRADAAEAEHLRASFLIAVSAFFRDPSSWARLREAAVRPLVRAAGARGVRAWSAGCAHGEEAYSLAMMLLEELPAERQDELLVLATDIDQAGLAAARKGRYTPERLAPLTAAQRARFFEPGEGMLGARQGLRSCIRFSTHDILADPAFARMDLVVCRNVTMYFAPEGVDRALRALTWSLRPGGYLFLGRGEYLHGWQEWYDVIDAHHHIYRRRNVRVAAA